MKRIAHKCGWIIAYAALCLAGLYIVLWLASYSGEGTDAQQTQEEGCLRRPRKMSAECGETP